MGWTHDPNWQPGLAEVAWTRDLIAMVGDHAQWGTTGGRYKFDKAKRQLRLKEKTADFDPEMHRRIVITFKKCGYEVLDDTNSN